MSRQEKEEQNNRQFLDEFLELYRQLSPWGRFQIDLYLKWLSVQRQLGKITWDWLMIQWKIDQAKDSRLHHKHTGFRQDK
jgi:hypothetical protein